MTEALLLVVTGSLLAVGVVTLVVCAHISRDARRSVELAGECMRYVREERARLLVSEEQERKQYPETPLAEELEQEREGRKQERREAERRIDHLERELQGLRDARREVQRESSPPVPVGLSEGLLETGRREKPLPTRKAREAGRTPRPESFPETSSLWEPTESSPMNKKSRRGVWMPHPDDGQGKAPTERTRAKNDAPVKMFRKHYDKYLENYQGYVELAEKLCQTRDNGQVTPGSPGEREWEKRLRRVSDGMERTTVRLDILEEHNPELATDDRVSRRASLARRHSELERSEQARS